jgi:hypothetical protein
MRSTLTGIEAALAEAGGVEASREWVSRLRALLARELAHGEQDLALARSGYRHPVVVAVASSDDRLVAVAPIPAALRADPDAAGERAWLLVAALVGALLEASHAPVRATLAAGLAGPHLALTVSGGGDADLAALAFEDQAAPIDRLRARALAVPAEVLGEVTDLRPPIGATHPLLVALEVARAGGRPADPASLAAHEDAVLAALTAGGVTAALRPHDDPDPARRIARRILQRLDGMGKWGGYHTEFAHLARGFAGNDRALAEEVGERLIAAGLLAEKPSVGQRHVFLNPRRAGDIRAFIERGDAPPGLALP